MSIVRLRMEIGGRVQGMGFRPFCAKLAMQFNLVGNVRNTESGVWIEVQGISCDVEGFKKELLRNPPAGAVINRTECAWLQSQENSSFRILESTLAGAGAWPPPDVATCSECIRELFDPENRRHRFPFISCTRCGPRYSILERLPYDRAHTTMSEFKMCKECEGEYQTPSNSRFHAQTIACSQCGPSVWLTDRAGREVFRGASAISGASELLRENGIVAIRGIGGFQLLVSACSEGAINTLRQRKRRDAKPFAVMFRTIASLKDHCEISPPEEELLTSCVAPITLVRRRKGSEIAAAVAPGNPYLGAFLPYSPLHHLLISEVRFPLVVTSGNVSGEVLSIDNASAITELSGIADAFLLHNRGIVRPLDDSVMRVLAGRAMVLRAGRGLAPVPVEMKSDLPAVLALGGHQKSSVALANGNCIMLSQHLGDLDAPLARAAFETAAVDLERNSKMPVNLILRDRHPDYASCQYAQRLAVEGKPVRSVQHHVAHIFSTLAECDLKPPVLGVAWDGTGLGDFGRIWGGEFFRVTNTEIQRVAHLLPFPLPGGEATAAEPCRTAAGVLFVMERWNRAPDSIRSAFLPREWLTLRKMLERSIHAPVCTSAGRLIDAVAAILGLARANRFEAQAAMNLEFAAECAERVEKTYVMELEGMVLDWRPALDQILSELLTEHNVAEMAMAFHNGLIDAIARVALREGISQVALSGGCFQNRLLLEGVVARLSELGFRVAWNCRVPINDGGLAAGQIAASLHPAGAQ